MRLWVGLELMGCRRTARPKGVCNGCLYTVTELGDNIKLSDGVNEINLSKEQVGEQLRYSWARAYYGVQGYTFDKRVLLMDTSHMHFTRRHAYVAVSRVRDPEKCHVPTPQQENTLLEKAYGVAKQLIAGAAAKHQEEILRKLQENASD